MTLPRYYLSLQYSAIQKTVLRHDRLWSISGISQALAKLNEIELYKITKTCEGDVVVAGGGKFTASFQEKDQADKARNEVIKIIATTFPMLEFQVSEVTEAKDLKDARDKKIIDGLNVLKNHFRGYAFTHNPHLELCEECGEYPAVLPKVEKNKEKLALCSICKTAYENCLRYINKNKEEGKTTGVPKSTTMERIYRQYYTAIYDAKEWPQIPLDFKDLFSQKAEASSVERKRMAVWFSDLNNMKDKVAIWLDQEDNDIITTFNAVKDVNIEIIVNALCATFKDTSNNAGFLPFRIIVAGGDDLRIVMDEKYILSFTKNISLKLHDKIAKLSPDHPLHYEWLQARNNIKGKPIQSYSFGGSFVITAVHTPFAKIHELCDELISKAKKETARMDNSVNWCISAEGEADIEGPFAFEKPLFIEKDKNTINNALSFNEYLELIEAHRKISPSHRYQIIEMITKSDKVSEVLETNLNRLAAKENDEDFIAILREPHFRNREKKLLPGRILTLFELMSIGKDGEARK